MLAALLPGAQNDLVRQELIRETQLAILKEELKPQSQLGLEKVMSEALLRASTGLPLNAAIDKTLKPLQESPVKTRLEEIIRLSLADDELVRFMSVGYDVNRQIEPKGMLNSVSRATQIIGSMFEQMANENGLEGSRLVWISRLGRIFGGLVEVAVPNSMLNLLLFHWLKILYFFEALLVVGAILFGASEVQTFGLKLLGVTLAANIAVLLLRDYMRLRRRWQHSLVFVLAAVVLGLSLMGAVNLYRLGLHGMLAHIAQFIEGIWERLKSL